MLRVLVLVSGGGTNLQAILDAVDEGSITNTEIVGVISNNKNAYALTRAREHGVAAQCISPKDFATREEFNEKFLEAVDEIGPDLIVLAGFLVVIPAEMIARYRNRIINIHPACCRPLPAGRPGTGPELRGEDRRLHRPLCGCRDGYGAHHHAGCRAGAGRRYP